MRPKKGILMNTLPITLLTTFCLSSFLYTMEKEITLTSLSPLKISNIKQIYNKTYDKITQITPTNNAAPDVLCEIIDSIKELETYNINEYQIGLFAFNQPTSAKNQLFNLTNQPYNGPAYISVFLERLRQYNELLTKSNFTSPTKEQLRFHRENQNKLTAMNNAASYGVYFTESITNQKKIFTAIPNTVAIEEFTKLKNDTFTMRCTSPEEITTTATVLYGDSNTKK